VSAQLERILNPDGAALLNDVRAFIGRFCAFPDESCLTAVTLWAVHAHMVKYFHITPRLALLSPEPASGKTRVLEILDLLTPESMQSIGASPAAIFRTLEKHLVTLLFDEVDAVFKVRGKSDSNEDLRALLNAGYKRGAFIPRCVGPKHEVVKFPVFCPVALAGLGDLPDTIMSRSIIIRMRRRAPNERVSEYRTRKHAPDGRRLRDRLAVWAGNVGEDTGDAEPELPPGVEDRPAEIWEPLIAVADAAGGDWPKWARGACSHLIRVAEDRSVSLGIRLLADLRTIFGESKSLPTEAILRRLCDGDELDADAPWSSIRGKELGSRGLASMLRDYGVKSRKVWIDNRALQGYTRESLWDAWQRYLPPLDTAATEGMECPEGLLPLQAKGPAEFLPDIPYLPNMQEPERGCRKCDGEGCRWCDNQLLK
jgi:hypothetical protein